MFKIILRNFIEISPMYKFPMPVRGAIGVPVTNSDNKPGIKLLRTKFVNGSGAIGNAQLAAWKVPGTFTVFVSSSFLANLQYNLFYINYFYFYFILSIYLLI